MKKKRHNYIYITVSFIIVAVAVASTLTMIFGNEKKSTIVQDTIKMVREEQLQKDRQNSKKKKANQKKVVYAENYDYSKPVAKSSPVSDTAFSNSAFIGNSRIEGFCELSGISCADVYAKKGMSVRDFMEKKTVKTDKGKVTMFSSMTGKNYDKIYVMFGLNELGWVDANLFAKHYEAAVKNLKEIYPNAQIYIQSILPVNEEKIKDNKDEQNLRIKYYNDLLMKIAKEEQVFYVNVAEIMTDKNGQLFEKASTDGVHLTKEYCQKWLQYLKTHTVVAQKESETGNETK